MSVKCAEFISFAKDCLERDDEIGYRNCIARSYYGVYHSVLLNIKNIPSYNHEGVIEYIKQHAYKDNPEYPKEKLKGLAYILSNMKAKRVIADYHLHNEVIKSDAEAAIETANKVFTKYLDVSEAVF